MRSVAKMVAFLCLLLTIWSAVAVVAHHHSNSTESLTCPLHPMRTLPWTCWEVA
jgi:hypothetical protein